MCNNVVPFFVHPSAVVDDGAVIDPGSKIWHFCHLMDGCRIGSNCILGQNVMVAPGVVVGNNVKVQNNVSLYSGLRCDDDVFIGPSCVFTNVTNPRAFINRKNEFKPTVLLRGCSLGANCTVVCGCTVGSYALVGAGCVVVGNVPNFALVVGNPSRQIGWVSRAGLRLSFDSSLRAVCPQTGEVYAINSSGTEVSLVLS